MALDPNKFINFWRDLQDLTSIVHQKLVQTEPLNLWELTVVVKDAFSSAMRNRTVSFAQEFLEEIAKTPLGYEKRSDEPPPWLSTYEKSKAWLDDPSKTWVDGSILRARTEEILMEHLTAIWLVLYFMSTPMGHLWERVCRVADAQGGYPTGACVTKLIGDVYRQSRLEQAGVGPASVLPSRRPSESLDKSSCVMVLTSYPSVLIRRLLTRSDQTKLTPGPLHQLGRCYALFQLRLYVAEGRPIRYLVPLEVLKRSWGLFSQELPHIGTAGAAELMSKWLAQVFPVGDLPGQSVELFSSPVALNLPTCVLGKRIGVATLDAGADDTRFVGTRVNNRLLNSYRHRFANVRLEKGISLLGKASQELSADLNVFQI